MYDFIIFIEKSLTIHLCCALHNSDEPEAIVFSFQVILFMVAFDNKVGGVYFSRNNRFITAIENLTKTYGENALGVSFL